MPDLPPPFVCTVASVTDGDTIRCANGTRVRIAGIQAPDRENSRPCKLHDLNYRCDDAAYARSKSTVTRLTLGQRLACRPVGRSYSRIVATCAFTTNSVKGGKVGQDLSCAIVKAGAAVWWPTYVRRYGMGVC